MVGRGRAAPSSGRMNDWPELLALAERQYGLVTREQIRRLGGSQAAVLRVARSSQWEPVTKQVLRRRGSPRTVDQMVMAAVLDAGGDATLAYLPGAAWWGVAGCVLDPLVLCTTKKARTRTGLATTHEVRWLPDRWVTELRGVRVARPELLAMQLHAICRPERAEVLVDRMWSRRLLSGPSIAQFIDEAGASGRNGITGLRAYFQPRGLKYIPPASGLEGRVKGLLGDAGIPMRPQVDSGGERWTGRVDFRHVDLPFIVEVQSEAHHAALVDQVADAVRIDQLVADGFSVVEISDNEVWLTARETVRHVEDCLRESIANGFALHFNRRTDWFAGQNL